MKGWSKTTRIGVMMALDTVFLAIELGVGYYVSSLALIADAFHMLNDIISLAVGLWAVNLARKESNDRYSYGWLRAEILGAFFNATFLIGLCVTIVLEAIQRFFDPPDISNPEVVLIVGCFGLVSNLVGFWVLGGHGHSHGPGEGDVESGHVHDEGHVHDHNQSYADHAVDDGPGDLDDQDCCPDEDEENSDLQQEPARANIAGDLGHNGTRDTRTLSPETARHIAFTGVDYSGAQERSVSRGSGRLKGTAGVRNRANSGRRVPTSIDDISIHPASFRHDIREIIEASQRGNDVGEEAEGDSGDSDDTTTLADNTTTTGETGSRVGDSEATERTPLMGGKFSQLDGAVTTENSRNSTNNKQRASLYGVTGDGSRGNGNDNGKQKHNHSPGHSHKSGHQHAHHHIATRSRRDSHGGHHHNEPRDPSSPHGHSHGDMGMNAMVLHVIGDALGNIGVIVTALIIWKTTWRYRMYADPVVSLFITLIILKTAIPLTKATSKILLQATPDHIVINDIREDIEDLDGVLSCHHVHVWQLSDSQIVASLHIEVAFPISEHGGERYMMLARRVRKCLHGYGIHSATIQPEFRLDYGAGDAGNQFSTSDNNGGGSSNRGRFMAASAALPSGAQNTGISVGAGAATSSATAPTTTPTTATSTTKAVKTMADGGVDVHASGPSCLLDCVDDCMGQGCCSQGSRAGSRTGSPPSSGGGPGGHEEGHAHAH